MNAEWIYYILMAVAALIGWVARPKLQPPAPNAPATPSPLPGDHPLLNLVLSRAQEQIRQAIQDALDKAMQDLVKPPPKRERATTPHPHGPGGSDRRPAPLLALLFV